MPTRTRPAGLPRRLGVGVILLALWLQALTPTAAPRAATAARAADALIHAVICGRDAGTEIAVDTDIAADLPAPTPSDCDRCPFCRCTAAAPLPVQTAVAVRRLVWRPVAWPIPPPRREPRPPRSPALARAPPLAV